MIGVDRIRRTLPHRFPIQLVDRVVSVVPGTSISTLKAVSANEPWCAWVTDARTDTDYDFPTALLIESWCQSAALLAAWDQDESQLADQVALFGGMSGVEIGEPVRPGDVIRNHVVVTKAIARTWMFEGSASVDGRRVLTVANVLTALQPGHALKVEAS